MEFPEPAPEQDLEQTQGPPLPSPEEEPAPTATMSDIILERDGLVLTEPPGPPPQEPDPISQEEFSYQYESRAWEKEPDLETHTVVTPLLDGEAVLTLLSGSPMEEDYAWEAGRLRQGMRMVYPEEAKKMEQIPISDRQIVESVRFAYVVCGSGESDDESICDQFPKSGCVKWCPLGCHLATRCFQ